MLLNPSVVKAAVKCLVHFKKSVFLKFAEEAAARFLACCKQQNPLKVSRSLIIYLLYFSAYDYTYVFKMYCFIQKVLIGGRKLYKMLIIYVTARSAENHGEFARCIKISESRTCEKRKCYVHNNCSLPLSHCKTRSL